MKQYDKIYVVDRFLPDYWLGGTEPLRERHNVIVLTIEELREVFKAGHNRAWDEMDGSWNQHAVNQPDFETYIQSKGI